ncbi:MAG: hypothetical protein KatS3mg110_2342 [Pirellulaceae bacterium]|nr:MAG: hypothetical protein KatS3mg110_2342 [Pirellulaceae bacterium]
MLVVGAVWVSRSDRACFVHGQAVGTGEAVVVFDEVDASVRGYLEQAQQFFSARQWSEAVQMLRRVMETQGQKLIWLPDAGDEPLRRYVPVHWYGQLQLMRWGAASPEVLAEYRSATAALCEPLWQKAQQHDERALRELLEYFFLTEFGARAALLYSEMELERGNTVTARGWLERLHPAMRSASGVPGIPAGRPLWLFLRVEGTLPEWLQMPPAAGSSASFLAHLNAPVGLDELRARAYAVSRWEGRQERIERERRLLAELSSDAQGTLAGRSGSWLDLIDSLPVGRQSPSEWTTFAGDPQRNGVWPEDKDPGGRPLWKVALPPVAVGPDPLADFGQARVGEGPDWALAYWPIVRDGQVWIAQANGIRVLDLATGRPLFGAVRGGPPGPENTGLVYTPPGPWLPRQQAGRLRLGVPRYTLSSWGPLVFARLGSAVTRGRGALDFEEAPSSWIIALDAEAEGRLCEGFPIEPPSREWTFDGTPVTDGQRLWVALRRQSDGRAEAAIAAYDLAGGRLLWMRPLATAESVGRGRWEEATHNLLTLHQGTLYCKLDLGFVAAVEGATGRLLWLVRYPRRLVDPDNPDGVGRHGFRDLTPVLAYHDTLVVAPADSDRLFALDAFSGQVLWCQPADIGSDIVHLLGIKDETLVASGDYLYWIDVRSGRLRAQFPPLVQRDPVAARPSPRGYGRGLIAGKRVLWPTRDALYLFDVEPAGPAGAEVAVPAGQPRPWSWYGVEPGHLVPASDRLLIAGTSQLAALPW